MSFFNKNKDSGAITSIIASNMPNDVFFVRYQLDARKPANKKDRGPCIVVNEREECAFIIKDGRLLDRIEGDKEFIFDRDELSGVIATLEVLFISKNALIRLKWGTPDKLLFEEQSSKTPVRIGLGGSADIRVGNPEKFYSKVVGRDSLFDIEKMYDLVGTMIVSQLRTAVTAFIEDNKLSYLRFDRYLEDMSKVIEPKLKELILREYGVEVNNFIISRFMMEDEDMKKLLNFAQAQEEKENKKRRESDSRQDYLEDKKHQREVEILKIQAETAAKGGVKKTKCPYCGAEQVEGAKFCHSCGKDPRNTCKKCQQSNPVTAKFCGNCGTAL